MNWTDKRGRFAAILILGIALGSGCAGEQWGFPRVAVRVASPDGRFVAFVKNHPAIDPPDQTLWLQSSTGRAIQVAQVPPDAAWCDRILWSADSRRVAFVIADAIVQVYDAQTSTRVFSGFVGRRSWDTPPRYVLREVSLSADGREITFRECERLESSIANCADARQTVAFSAMTDALW